MSSNGRLWTLDEVSEALELYCITPFGRMHKSNPEIIALAHKLGRTPSSIALKLTNFAALDQSLPRKGMSNYSKLDAVAWSRFFRTELEATSAKPLYGFSEDQQPFNHEGSAGEDVLVIAKARRGQDRFRATILTIYGGRCAVTGVSNPELLVASHIVPWADRQDGRIDPTNGLCLNAFYDKAFDRGLITFDEDFRLVASSRLAASTKQYVQGYVGKPLAMPDRFRPSQAHLEHHRNNIFAG